MCVTVLSRHLTMKYSWKKPAILRGLCDWDRKVVCSLVPGSSGGSWVAGCTAAKDSASSLYASLRSCCSLNLALFCGLNIFWCVCSVTVLSLYISVRAWKAIGVQMARGFCLSLLYKEAGLHAPTLLCKANQHLEVGSRLRDSLWTHFLSKPKCLCKLKA